MFKTRRVKLDSCDIRPDDATSILVTADCIDDGSGWEIESLEGVIFHVDQNDLVYVRYHAIPPHLREVAERIEQLLRGHLKKDLQESCEEQWGLELEDDIEKSRYY